MDLDAKKLSAKREKLNKGKDKKDSVLEAEYRQVENTPEEKEK